MRDLIVIGGGIVGVATALRLQRDFPGLRISLLEKERDLACHQSGHNSGVIHAGIYYPPESLKARFCREGLTATYAFCAAHGLAAEKCGKLIVATDDAELERMEALYARAVENDVALERVSARKLARLEPHISGRAALLSPLTGITDYRAITRKMAEIFEAGGGRIRRGACVTAIREEEMGVTIEANAGSFRAGHVVACAGSQADRLARMSGLGGDFMIIPFRGEYFRLASRHDHVTKHLIYPVPDPALPFLGVHLTRMIGGYVTVGPNAVLAGARDGYRMRDISLRDISQMVGFAGFRRMFVQNLRHGLSEFANSLSRRRYLEACRKYCPSLELSDLEAYPSGVRAQAVMQDGAFVHDFLIRNTGRVLHVCNAPSPAATSAMPIAAHISGVAADVFGL